MDRNGEIIYHPRQKAIYSGMVKENNRMASTYEDGTHIENFMGEERAVVVKTIGYTGWKIVNVTPTSKLFRNAIHIGFFMVMICTVTIFLILLEISLFQTGLRSRSGIWRNPSGIWRRDIWRMSTSILAVPMR